MEKPVPGSWVPLQAELSVYTRNYLTPFARANSARECSNCLKQRSRTL